MRNSGEGEPTGGRAGHGSWWPQPPLLSEDFGLIGPSRSELLQPKLLILCPRRHKQWKWQWLKDSVQRAPGACIPVIGFSGSVRDALESSWPLSAGCPEVWKASCLQLERHFDSTRFPASSVLGGTF